MPQSRGQPEKCQSGLTSYLIDISLVTGAVSIQCLPATSVARRRRHSATSTPSSADHGAARSPPQQRPLQTSRPARRAQCPDPNAKTPTPAQTPAHRTTGRAAQPLTIAGTRWKDWPPMAIRLRGPRWPASARPLETGCRARWTRSGTTSSRACCAPMPRPQMPPTARAARPMPLMWPPSPVMCWRVMTPRRRLSWPRCAAGVSAMNQPTSTCWHPLPATWARRGRTTAATAPK